MRQVDGQSASWLGSRLPVPNRSDDASTNGRIGPMYESTIQPKRFNWRVAWYSAGLTRVHALHELIQRSMEPENRVKVTALL
jgi:hypothetical protein